MCRTEEPRILAGVSWADRLCGFPDKDCLREQLQSVSAGHPLRRVEASTWKEQGRP